MADPLVDLVDSSEATAYLTAAGQPAPANLAAIITGVSSVMQQYASRNFVAQPYSVVLDGHGGDRVSLPNFPITAVAAVSVDGVNVPAAANALQSGFVFSETQVLLRGYRFNRGVQNVSLTYTAGYPVGNGAGQMPADLRIACCQGIAAVVASLDYDDPRAIELKSGGSSIKLATAADIERLCLTGDVTSVLNQRARVTPC